MIPITEVYLENSRPVQYFERTRFEWYGDLVLTQVGLLGRWAASEKQNLPAFKSVEPPTIPTVDFFAQTGHTLSYGFRDFWRTHGGLAVFGFPISEEFQEQNQNAGQLYIVLYFERSRFEYHPKSGRQHEAVQVRLHLGLS